MGSGSPRKSDVIGRFSLALHGKTLGRIRPLVRVLSEAKQFKIAEVGIDQLDV
jgi:hypothetical protein